MGNTAENNLKKQPSEVKKFSMDFSNVLESNELILTTNVTSQLYSGGTSDISISSVSIVDQTGVSMFISSGTDGSRYRVEVLVSTNTGQTLEGDGILIVPTFLKLS